MSTEILLGSEDHKICKNISHFCKFRGYEIVKSDNIEGVHKAPKYEVQCKKGDETVRIIYISQSSRYNKPSELRNIITEDKIVLVKAEGSKIKAKKIKIYPNIELVEGRLLLTNFEKYLRLYSCRAFIVSEDEVYRIMSLYKIPSKKNFPYLANTSREAVWLGASIGDIVYLEYPTIASCEITGGYRMVMPEVQVPEDDDAEPQD